MRKNNINLRILFFMLLSIVMIKTNAQTGLNFQGVARTTNNVILASQAITIKLSILQGSSTGTVDYTETRRVTTNAQGLFTAVIGDTGAISTLGNFTTINWKLSPKFLKIEMDPAAGNNFMTMGTTQFQYVAYAQFAKSVDAENIVGIVPVTLGGTGVNSLTGLKTALTINNVNNTTDLTKPISTLTQTALDLKLNATDTIKYTKQTYSDSALLTKLKISDTAAMLSSRIARDTLNLSNRINLKVSTTDVNSVLDLKLNKADTIKYTKQTYSDSTLLTKLKISDTAAMLSNRIGRDTLNLSARINLKANISDLTSGLALKENAVNKSTATDLGAGATSDILYPTQKAVKSYVDAQINSGGVADGGITTSKLADGAVTYAKFQSIPTNTILGNTSSSTTSVQAIATTGSDNVVLSTSPMIISPILITPNIGVATATSINDVIINGFKFKSDVPSLTITGTTTLQGNNTGDNATNTKYENFLTYGAVDLITDQAIAGKKTFLNNIIMANLLGVGSITPTTINFANGSQIGDIQNLSFGNPDAAGSIDLFAPDGAKWVQMNYGNKNYFALHENDARISVGSNKWYFDGDGTTKFPGTLKLGSTTFTNQSTTNGYVLTYNNGNAVWQAPAGTSVSDNIDANTLSGTILKSTITGSSLTSVGTLVSGSIPYNLLTGTVPTWNQNTTGNAATATTATTAGTASTATKLSTARNINGVAFDGSGDITITASADAGTLTGTTLKSTITGSSLTSVGTLVSGSIPYTLLTETVPTWNQNTTGNAATAATAGNITATSNTTLSSLSNLTTVGTITSGVWSGTTINIANGGTGAATKSTAFDALSPMTTSGDIIYGGASGTGTRLVKGTDGQLLSLASGFPTWTTPTTTTAAVFLPTIVIGTQQWMRENLDVMTYRNGDVIPQVTDPTAWAGLTTGAWCYYNNDPLNGAIYGKLYNWYAVNDPRGLAPQGWHIPTDAEWTTLISLLGGYSVAGGKAKTTGVTKWASPNNASNESGFAGLPGGLRLDDGSFLLSGSPSVGTFGIWWGATPDGCPFLYSYNNTMQIGYSDKKSAQSVRCIRD
jgi:uncharacterized protein (TIGR02145 family)